MQGKVVSVKEQLKKSTLCKAIDNSKQFFASLMISGGNKLQNKNHERNSFPPYIVQGLEQPPTGCFVAPIQWRCWLRIGLI